MPGGAPPLPSVRSKRTTISTLPSFDAYAAKARFSVLGIVAAPVLVFAAYAGISPLLGLALPAAITACLAAWGSEAIRSRGLSEERHLLSIWDQFPTTRALRLRGNEHATIRRRYEVQTLTGERLPTQAEEEEDPSGADQIIARVVKRLLVQMRGSASYNDILQNENASYGFHRNMLAMRIPALIILDVSIAMNAVAALFSGEFIACLVVALVHGLLLVAWIALVNVRRVTEQSERFADRFWVNVEEMAAAQLRVQKNRGRLLESSTPD